MSQNVATPGKKKWPRWAKAFLRAFAQVGVIGRAAQAANISRRQVERFRLADANFAERMEEAKEDAADLLIEEAIRRGRDGWEEPVIWQGELCGYWVDQNGTTAPEAVPGARFVPLTVRKYSDMLLVKAVQWLRPELREGKVEVTGKDGGPIRTEAKMDAPVPISAEERMAEVIGLLEVAQARAEAAQAKEAGEMAAE